MKISSTQFRSIAKLATNSNNIMPERIYRASFGISSFLTSKLWDLMQPIHELHTKYKPRYLLWTLLFLKQYNSDDVNANIAGVSPKTFRLWVWITIDAIANKTDQVVSL